MTLYITVIKETRERQTEKWIKFDICLKDS